MTRRDFLFHSGGGLGGIALAALLGARRRARGGAAPQAEGQARRAAVHGRRRASHVDLFDYKPELVKQHGKPSDFGETGRGVPERPRPVAQAACGTSSRTASAASSSSEVVAPLGDVVDEMAFVHNVVGKTGVHSQGTLLQTTGFNRPGFPGMGCWVELRPRQR